MIKGWRLSPAWTAYYETVKAYRELKRQQKSYRYNWPVYITPHVVDVDESFENPVRSH